MAMTATERGDRDAEILRRWRAGERVTDLALEHDIHRADVYAVIYRGHGKLGGGVSRLAKQGRNEQLLRDRLAGETLRGLGTKYGLDRKTVSRILAHMTAGDERLQELRRDLRDERGASAGPATGVRYELWCSDQAEDDDRLVASYSKHDRAHAGHECRRLNQEVMVRSGPQRCGYRPPPLYYVHAVTAEEERLRELGLDGEGDDGEGAEDGRDDDEGQGDAAESQDGDSEGEEAADG